METITTPTQRVTRAFVIALTAAMLASCAYVHTVLQQGHYAAQQRRAPKQLTYKHMIERDTFFVFGRVALPYRAGNVPAAVVAISDDLRKDELVDISQFVRSDSYFGLHLPAGQFRIYAVTDNDHDGYFESDEIAAGRKAILAIDSTPEKVLSEFDLDSNSPFEPAPSSLRIKVQQPQAAQPSVFLPKGTIRRLDDPIFSEKMASVGLYEPAVFMERAPMLFYAMEEPLGYKVPVIFVHGINGSPRDFVDVVQQLDLRRYTPWYFFYPSGMDLTQLSEMFYRIFLSGRTVPRQQVPVVIVAHSMGGLIVRNALNQFSGSAREQNIRSLITIASPLGGFPAAAQATRAPVVIPSWRSLDPQSPFIRTLYRKPLAPQIRYDLVSTHANESMDPDSATDGVVPLRSQLVASAQAEANAQTDIRATHTGVLHDPAAVQQLVEKIAQAKTTFPEDHLRYLDMGGFDLDLGRGFTDEESFFIHSMGHYMAALNHGIIAPNHPAQNQFVEESRGMRSASLAVSRAWLKLKARFPETANQAVP